MDEPDQLKNIIEAALLAAGGPLSLDHLQALFEEAEQPDKKRLRAVLESLAEDYAGRGIEIREVASGWRIQVRQDVSHWVSRLWSERPPRYSRALLETLALIAYRQPITRGEIEDIRGVSVSSNIIKTLLEREWIRVVGQRDVPGKPSLYGTTREFLDYFNLKSLDELPTLAEIRDLDEINRELQLEDPDQPQKSGESTEGEASADAQPETEASPEGDAQDAPEPSEMAEPSEAAEPPEAEESADTEASPALEEEPLAKAEPDA